MRKKVRSLKIRRIPNTLQALRETAKAALRIPYIDDIIRHATRFFLSPFLFWLSSLHPFFPYLHPFDNPVAMDREIIDALIKFRNERDWEQFHNPKDLALAISIEAGELLELFLWKKPEDADKEKVKQELADILAFSYLLAEKYGFDVKEIVLEKIKLNAEKYPVDKAKGTARKYDEL